MVYKSGNKYKCFMYKYKTPYDISTLPDHLFFRDAELLVGK
jgi:hypothetical protein